MMVLLGVRLQESCRALSVTQDRQHLFFQDYWGKYTCFLDERYFSYTTINRMWKFSIMKSSYTSNIYTVVSSFSTCVLHLYGWSTIYCSLKRINTRVDIVNIQLNEGGRESRRDGEDNIYHSCCLVLKGKLNGWIGI